MAADEQAHGEQNAMVVREILRCIDAREVQGVPARCTDDVVYEFPFAPPGVRDRCEGKAALERFITGVVGLTRRTTIEDARITPMTTPDRVLAEFRGDWELANGRPYRNTYVVIADLRDGRVCHWREYYNPLVVQDAFAPATR
jgi:ketosteroid isomerase-like protein